ncbi:MAG TPA: DUF5694 domain-containing protein [Sphingomicrobium sp.]|nr:DUF5694 domain-containing protein [Sphingomicrobium sp.]
MPSLLSLMTAASLAAAQPYAPPLGPNPAVAGPRTQFLNLGSAHLSEFKAMQPAMLEPLLERLAKYRPTIITHEGLSGEQCEMMRLRPKYADTVKTYCWDASPAQTLAGMTQPQAEAEAERTLAEWAAARVQPSAAQRRRLALLFLAAGDRGSAWVQWLRLPAAERRAADGLDQKMVEALNRDGKPMNESYNVAAVLAARLGLERVHAVDDHSSDGPLTAVGEAHGKAMGVHFEGFKDHPLLKEYLAQAAQVKDGGSMLAFYRFMNEPARIQAQIEGDFGGAFANARIAPYGRYYGAWWETRNMRMLANIRAATITAPGARVLNVVGASHKPWYDTWMRQWADAEVIAVEPLLK